MQPDLKLPQYMTSQELEEAIRKHRDHVKRLLAEAKSHRAEAEGLKNRLDKRLKKDN